MVTMVENGVAYSPVNMPSISTQTRAKTIYDHTAHRTSHTTMDLSITVWLQIQEEKSGKIHKLMNATSKFTFENIEGKPTEEDIFKAWAKSFDNLYMEFLKLLFSLRMPKMPCDAPNRFEMSNTLQGVLKLFDRPYIPEK